MRPHLKQLFQNLGLFFGLFVSQANNKADVARFLNGLGTVDTGLDMVRVGPQTDGGYTIPEDFDGIAAVFSPGVGNESRFEYFFAELGVPCFLLDGSIDEPVLTHKNFHFDKAWLSTQSVDNAPIPLISLEKWVKNNAPKGDLILQMDIEGSEVEVILSTTDEMLNRFRTIAIEIHGLSAIWSPHGLKLFQSLFGRLNNSHAMVGMWANGSCRSAGFGGLTVPNCVEATFLRRDRLQHKKIGPKGH